MTYRAGPGCPRCKQAFAPAPEGKTECGGCGGVWIDEQTLAKLWEDVVPRKRNLPQLDARKDRDRVRACAVCALDMEKVMLDAVSIDRCAKHGLWFDRGELEAALASARLEVYNSVDD